MVKFAEKCRRQNKRVDIRCQATTMPILDLYNPKYTTISQPGPNLTERMLYQSKQLRIAAQRCIDCLLGRLAGNESVQYVAHGGDRIALAPDDEIRWQNAPSGSTGRIIIKVAYVDQTKERQILEEIEALRRAYKSGLSVISPVDLGYGSSVVSTNLSTGWWQKICAHPSSEYISVELQERGNPLTGFTTEGILELRTLFDHSNSVYNQCDAQPANFVTVERLDTNNKAVTHIVSIDGVRPKSSCPDNISVRQPFYHEWERW